MVPLGAFLLPISFGYVVQAPWGLTRQMVTVNAPQFVDNHEAAVRYGRLLWAAVTAPAVSSSVSLPLMTVTYWKGLGPGTVEPIANTHGMLTASASPRDHSGQLLLMTGHPDDDGKRRFFLPGIPRDWHVGGLLTTQGWEKMLAHARGIIMGLGPVSGVETVEWLLAYPGAIAPAVGNPVGVAFRRIQHVTVCSHTDKAPEYSG